VERNRDKSLGVTVYKGQRAAMPARRTFSERPFAQTVQAAYDIARFTAEDPVAGLPDADDIAQAPSSRDLDLFHPWAIDSEAGRTRWHWPARQQHWPPTGASPTARALAFRPSKAIFSAPHARLSRRLCQLAPQPFGGPYRFAARRNGDEMQRDAWYSSMRSGRPGLARGRGPLCRPARAEPPGRARSPPPPARCCLNRTLAAGLLGGFVQAVSGGLALPQEQLFARLAGQDGVSPSTSTFWKTRLCWRGKGSSPFDEEGVRVRRARWCRAGGCRAIS
jgi:PmbA protein